MCEATISMEASRKALLLALALGCATALREQSAAQPRAAVLSLRGGAAAANLDEKAAEARQK